MKRSKNEGKGFRQVVLKQGWSLLRWSFIRGSTALTVRSKVLAMRLELARSPPGVSRINGLKMCDTARFILPGVRLMEKARLTRFEILF